MPREAMPGAAGRQGARWYNPAMPFVTLEGLEGCGKSTQARRLAERLGPSAVVTKEPGGTAIGASVREILLSHASRGLVAPAESLLYFADRAQHVAEVIRPALAAGKLVVSDRYVESSLAYQGHGRGLDREVLRQVAHLATGGLRPDLIVLLELPIEEGLLRVGRRGGHDRMESEVREFHERVRAGYAEMAAGEPQLWARVSGEGTEDAVTERLWSVLESRGLLVGPVGSGSRDAGR